MSLPVRNICAARRAPPTCAHARSSTPLWRSIGGVVFFDVGEVRRAPFSWSLDALQYGTGVGVRYFTIVGPLRLDLAFPIDPPSGEPSWKIHFSIGQAF